MIPLPIDPLLPELVAVLGERRALVLEAPPGAGKTTRVPPSLLGAGWLVGEVLVLEPRRIAARMAAARVAADLGETVGETVGYQIRFDRRGGKSTRICFVTEGVLTRRLMTDPQLAGVGAVVLDEIHERHLHTDLAFAMLGQLRDTRRPDLAVLAMSATLEAASIAERLNAPILRCDTRPHPVAIEYLPSPSREPLEIQVAMAARRLLSLGASTERLDGATDRQAPRHVLVFLAGAAEIRAATRTCEPLARDLGAVLCPLHGELPAREQDRAVALSDRPKIVLATNVAESSITIDGVSAVVDAGWVKQLRRATGASLRRLERVRISKASATQRAGRAGRTAPGRCARLYTASEHARMAEHDEPEILRADLAEAILSLRLSGVRDVRALPWLTTPHDDALAEAEQLLFELGALDDRGAPTPDARSLARLPLHPRLGRALLEGRRLGVARSAATAVAILAERGDLRKRRVGLGTHGRSTLDASLWSQLEAFERAREADFAPAVLDALDLDRGAVHAVLRAERQLAPASDTDIADDAAGALGLALLKAHPDRIAKRIGDAPRAGAPVSLALAGGGNAVIGDASSLSGDGLLVAVDITARPNQPAWVQLGVPVTRTELIDVLGSHMADERTTEWNAALGRVDTIERLAYRGLVLDETRRPAAPGPVSARVLIDAARRHGLERIDPGLGRWLARAELAGSSRADFPRVDEAYVLAALERAAETATSLDELVAMGLCPLLEASLDGKARAWLYARAPERVRLASGRELDVEYVKRAPPALASYLQDFYGMAQGPQLGGAPLVLSLWAPNKRPVQVTSDLGGFWERHYPALRRQLMRRYPKHHWPEDPRRAQAKRLTRDQATRGT